MASARAMATLPASSAVGGKMFFINNVSAAGTLTVNCDGSDTFYNGPFATSFAIPPLHQVAIYADGSAGWRAFLYHATAANFRAKSGVDGLLTPGAVWDAAAAVTLTDAATIATDMSTFIHALVTIGGNRTLGNPSNAKPGQGGTIGVIEDGTGGRTLAFASNYKHVGGVTPSIVTTAGTINLFDYWVRTSSEIWLNYLGVVA